MPIRTIRDAMAARQARMNHQNVTNAAETAVRQMLTDIADGALFGDHAKAISDRANHLFLDRCKTDHEFGQVLGKSIPSINQKTGLPYDSQAPFSVDDLLGLEKPEPAKYIDPDYFTELVGGPIDDVEAEIKKHPFESSPFTSKFQYILTVTACRANAARLMQASPKMADAYYDRSFHIKKFGPEYDLGGVYRTDHPLWDYENKGTCLATTRLLDPDLLKALDDRYPLPEGSVRLTGCAGMCQYMALALADQTLNPEKDHSLWGSIVDRVPVFGAPGVEQEMRRKVSLALASHIAERDLTSTPHNAADSALRQPKHATDPGVLFLKQNIMGALSIFSKAARLNRSTAIAPEVPLPGSGSTANRQEHFTAADFGGLPFGGLPARHGPKVEQQESSPKTDQTAPPPSRPKMR